MHKLSVIGYAWHIGHQHSLAQMPFVDTYDLLINPYRSWSGNKSRPLLPNMTEVAHYESGKYDLAILHIDQQAIDENSAKFKLFTQANEAIKDIPKVVINHMTPFHDDFSIEETIEKIRAMVGDIPMIVNSHQAREQWGWGNTIIHGVPEGMFYPQKKEPVITTFLSPAGMERAYNRKFLHDVVYNLREMGFKLVWIGQDRSFSNFEQYRDWLSRSLVYFHPAKNSPMPRSRTEAMFSGCCVVSTPYHDADTFIEDGVNGFLASENAMETAELLASLVSDRTEEAKRIGQEGIKTAQELFNFDRYADDWIKFLKGENIL